MKRVERQRRSPAPMRRNYKRQLSPASKRNEDRKGRQMDLSHSPFSSHKRRERSNSRERKNMYDDYPHQNDNQHFQNAGKSHEMNRQLRDEYYQDFPQRSSSNKSHENIEESYLDREIVHHNNQANEPILDPSAVSFSGSYKNMSFNETPAAPSQDRLERLEKVVETLLGNSTQNKVNSQLQAFIEQSKNEQEASFGGIPQLVPSNSNFTTSMWLNRIHEECLNNNFDEKTCIRFLQSCMSGILKMWFKSLHSYDFTWPELRMIIAKMFPDNTDFAKTLRLLVGREKMTDEPMSQYFFSKLYLCDACKITGENAVSCIIDGLNNPFMKQEIKSIKFLTPEILYAEYLSKLPEKECIAPHEPYRDIETYHSEDLNSSREKLEKFRPRFKHADDRCKTCHKMGHQTKDCRHAPVCYNCKKKGHIAAKCSNV